MSTKQWHAIYTKPRWEKKIADKIEECGIVSYCPLNKVQRRWSDRLKIVHEPLFKSYVFVHVDFKQMSRVRNVTGVVNFVYWNGLPAVIKETEIETIKRFLKEYQFVRAESILIPKQRVIISNGLLMNKEGVVIRTEKNSVQLFLDSLGYKLIADLKTNEVRPV